jgi:2-keto-4-pentenoate hydratase
MSLHLPRNRSIRKHPPSHVSARVLSASEVQQAAEQILSDYDAGCPNALFAERGAEWFTLADAYAIQHAVAALRRARGERCRGYKAGCLSPVIQRQLGLDEPVRGYLWASEEHDDGCRLPCASYANLAVEGEIAVRMNRSVATGFFAVDEVVDAIDCWFPVIELHNYIFRGGRPTSQELVAGNAMHAGFVALAVGKRQRRVPTDARTAAELAGSDIAVYSGTGLCEAHKLAELPGGPLGSVRWLATALARAGEPLQVGDLVLTGSPGSLIPVGAGHMVRVEAGGMIVESRFY